MDIEDVLDIFIGSFKIVVLALITAIHVCIFWGGLIIIDWGGWYILAGWILMILAPISWIASLIKFAEVNS